MPLSEHEQRILEEIERKLIEDDPALARQVAETSLHSHLARRIRLAALAFVAGFIMLVLFLVPSIGVPLAIAGFVIMLLSGLLVYHYLKRLGRDQIQSLKRGGRFSLSGVLARLAERFRGPQNRPPT
jgi:Flp pilus assembly protein TadB